MNKTDEMTVRALSDGVLAVDFVSGAITGPRWPKPMGCKNQKGYRVFTLHLDGCRCQVKAHRAVWIAAHGPIPAGYVIDHINRDKADNRLENLRLADAKANSQNRRSYAGEGNPGAILTQKGADEIRATYAHVKSYAVVADHYGVSKSLVAKIIRGEIWKEKANASVS